MSCLVFHSSKSYLESGASSGVPAAAVCIRLQARPTCGGRKWAPFDVLGFGRGSPVFVEVLTCFKLSSEDNLQHVLQRCRHLEGTLSRGVVSQCNGRERGSCSAGVEVVI